MKIANISLALAVLQGHAAFISASQSETDEASPSLRGDGVPYHRKLSVTSCDDILRTAAVAFYDFEQVGSGPFVAVNQANPGIDDVVSDVLCRDDGRVGQLSLAVPDRSPHCVAVDSSPSSALTDLGIEEPDFTIQFWAKTDDWTASQNLGLVALANELNNSGGANQWYVGINTGNNFLFNYRDSGPSFEDVIGPSATTCTDGQWCHIAVTVDQTAAPPVVKFYINGDLESTVDISGTPLQDNPNNLAFFIGTNPPLPPNSGPGARFDGAIDEVGIYDEVLSSAVISSVADRICTGIPPEFTGKSAKGSKAPGSKMAKSTKVPKSATRA